MARSTLVLGLLCGVLGGALGTTLYHQSQPTDEAAIRAIVAETLAGRTTEAALPDPTVFNQMIESYLMSDPRVLQRLSSALDTELRTEQRETSRVALAAAQEQIYADPANIVLGNPEGDVTLVELFDYNCSFCRNALPDLAELLETDPDLKVVLKEFPILSRESVEAARVALVVAEKDVDYWAFHEALFTSRGQVSGQTALAAAQTLGLSPISVELDMQSKPVTDALTRTVALARQLNITGTPTYILGDEIIPGAVGIETLRQKIANIRACGSTQCSS